MYDAVKLDHPVAPAAAQKECDALWALIGTLDELKGKDSIALLEANGYEVGEGKGKLSKDDQVYVIADGEGVRERYLCFWAWAWVWVWV